MVGDEGRNTKVAYEKILQEIGHISVITSDGDSKASLAVEELNRKQGLPPPVKQRDPGHFKRTHMKYIRKQPFSGHMLHKLPSNEKEKNLRRLARDLAIRCAKEIDLAITKFKKNLSNMQTFLKNTHTAILLCLQGKHSKCNSHSLCCSPKKRWSSLRITPLACDIDLLKACISYRLNESAISKSYRGHSTQKAEAANRSLRSSLPRGTLYKRNAIGRVASTIHRLNNNLDSSLPKQLEHVGLDIKNRCSRIVSFLNSIKSSIEYDKLRQKSTAFRTRRVQLCLMRHARFWAKNKLVAERASYAKGMLDPPAMRQSIQNIKEMHSYHKDLTKSENLVKNDHSYG